MWVIRAVRNINTRKIEQVKVVDENSKSFMLLNATEAKNMLKSIPGIIANLEIDNYGNLRLLTMTKNRNSKAYSATIRGDYTIQHYCIVTGYYDGCLNWIADDSNISSNNNNILWGETNTLSEIANRLNVKIPELKFFNAYIDKYKGKDCIYLYAGNNSYKQLGAIIDRKESKVTIGDNWEAEYTNTPSGINVQYLEHKQGLLDTTLPSKIYHLEKFGGGVNNLTLPDSITSLGDECFSELDDLYTIRLGKGLSVIPDRCFADSKIQQIQFSGSEVIIEDEAFTDCYKLKCGIVTAAEKIGNNAFDMCPLQFVKLSRAKEIGAEAFMDTAVKQVILNEGLRIIKRGAFRNCNKLETIDIPSSVEKIGSYAFHGCSKLKAIYLNKHTQLGIDVFPKNTRVIYK